MIREAKCKHLIEINRAVVMGRSCAVVDCKNNNGKLSHDEKGNKITFHSFPMKDKKVVEEWLAKLKRNDFGKPYNLSSHQSIEIYRKSLRHQVKYK